MLLKRKIGLSKKSAFLCLLLVVGSFASALSAEEKAKFIVNDAPFIFRNQKLIPGKKYTLKDLEAKIGKAFGVADKAKLLEVIYKEERLIFMFDRQNYFCGFEFFITNEDTDPIVIYDLEIRPDDTYNSIQKKIKALKITYNLYEKEGTNPMIDMDFISKKFGKVNITIICAESGRQPVLMATALYMDLIHE